MKLEKLYDIVDRCPVEFYLSANDGCHVHWPYRMQPVHEASTTYRSDAEKYIVDSSFSREEITNVDVLDKAHRLGADMVVLEDVYQDFTGTVEKVQEGLALAAEHQFSGTTIAPLQQPYVKCWRELREPHTVAIGGLKDAPASEKVRVAQKLRDAAGPNIWIHGLGWGATDALVNAIRNEPHLLDSIDAQTPYAQENNSSIWKGEHKSVPTAIKAQANLIEGCRRMNPNMTEHPTPEQHDLTGW